MRTLWQSDLAAQLSRVVLVIAALGVVIPEHGRADTLYVGDTNDNTIKGFDSSSGDFLGAVVKQSLAGLHGPRGILVPPGGNLLVSDQNVGTATNGDILLYSSETGALLSRVVPNSDPDAAAVPRGIALSNDGRLFVADLTAETRSHKPPSPGRVRVYTQDGSLLTDIVPDQSFPLQQFHPRAVVIGPDDGYLYVSNFPNLDTGLGGDVLRFTVDGSFLGVFVHDEGGAGRLNRPEGLAFGPDGKLYVTSFRANANDADKIMIYNNNGKKTSEIDLDASGQPRAFAQALLFGPNDDLFVPISGNGPDTGAIRRYDVKRKKYVNFVPPNALGGPLGAPWYLTFGGTDPGTLEYNPAN